MRASIHQSQYQTAWLKTHYPAEFLAANLSSEMDDTDKIVKLLGSAKKMNIEMSTLTEQADNLLDFETSIGSEMEASMLIGKQLNFNKARELALSGDLVGAAQDVVSQIGGQAELEQMNVIQRRALADSIGVSVEELSRLAGGKMTLEDASEDINVITFATSSGLPNLFRGTFFP